MRQLQDWPRPKDDTGIGLHLSANAYDDRYRDAAVRQRDVDLWRHMGVKWLKVVTASDSQLVAVAELVRAGFEVIVRFWADRPHPEYVPAVDLMQRFAGVGVRYVEGGNEPELQGEWSGGQSIAPLARQYVRFADNAYRAGVLPVTYSIEGDRLQSWFLPMAQAIIGMGRRDALEGSAVGIHNRPGRMPVLSPPIDATHGGVGFTFRSYEAWDDAITALMGAPLPLLGTEAGREPPEVDGDLAKHAADNVAMAVMPWRPALFCQCFWLWCPGGMGDNVAWVLNPTHGPQLPVVESFRQMTKTIRNAGSEPEQPEIPQPDTLADLARKWADEDMKDYPWGQKWAVRHGCVPFGDELPFKYENAWWYCQPAFSVRDGKALLIVFPDGGYSDAQTKTIEWTA